MVTSIDSSLLLNYYSARAGIGGAPLSTSAATLAAKKAPTAPWTKSLSPEGVAALSDQVKAALAGRKIVNEGAAQLDVPGASADYRKLFALYQGLSTLSGIIEQAQKKGVSSSDLLRLQKTFASGLEEVDAYVKTAKLDKVRLTAGEVGATAKTTAPVASAKTEYVTAPIFSGTSADAVPQFQGNVKFSIDVKRSGVTFNVPIDLSAMTGTRSMANVVNFINDQLTAAGVDTRFATQRLPGQPKTTTVAGKTVTLGTGPDQWAFKVQPRGETVSFSATDTAGAVYMAQGIGDPNPDGKILTNDGVVRQQLVKFQTDTAVVDTPIAGQNDANFVDGRAFAKTLGAEVKNVRATQVGSDGSVYMLADVTAKTGGQELEAAQDVALLKYDPAGNLVYTRTLGASDTATGLGLALSADGKQIAIAGSVTGVLNGAQDGALNSGTTGTYAGQTDSFVTVFNGDGEEQWTTRRGARQADEASQITFGADGKVYVAGRSKSSMPGATNNGDYDGYIEAFGPPVTTGPLEGRGKIPAIFTQNLGTSASDRPAGMVMDGTSLVVASVENGRGVLRRFDVSSGTPVQTSTRDLGDLMGGDITGLALDNGNLVIGGWSSNGALATGNVTKTIAGGSDAFVARISADLSAGPGDAIAYYGGTGDDQASALSVSNGKVYIAGSTKSDLPGQPVVGKKDGFLANINIDTGAADWSRRFTGKDGFSTPSAIAVDPTGASALDRLGLPKGTLDMTDSPKLTAESSLRPGEEFTVRVGTGRPTTITIDAKETLDTLAQKIRRATGFQAKVTIGTAGGVRKLTIAPQTSRATIEFNAGRIDKDALGLLGIPEGVVRATTVDANGKSLPADGKGQIYGLSLANDMTLKTPQDMAHAAAEVAAAMGVIRNAYKDLTAIFSPKTAADKAADAAAAAAATGKVPAYLTNQISNYQAALDRLTGGG